jgi:hypothetical protein
MLPQARITAVKDAGGEERRLLCALAEGARLMRAEVIASAAKQSRSRCL